MAVGYDKYYQTENLFGNPYPELIDFFHTYQNKGKLLDVGCGQGRDAIALALMGFEVTGIDHSKVGIAQMNEIAVIENLSLTGRVTDIFEFKNFNEYDFVLLDSMFHFEKNDLKKETDFIKRILSEVKRSCLIVFCIQDTGKKVEILNNCFNRQNKVESLHDQKFDYIFEDKETGHKSKSPYRMIIVKSIQF